MKEASNCVHFSGRIFAAFLLIIVDVIYEKYDCWQYDSGGGRPQHSLDRRLGGP
jgi:hypothetical protein